MRMMLQSQVFPILSKGVGETRIKMIWKSLTRYLRDKKLGGFRLNTDFGSPYLTFGRAFGFSYGDKENGAFFNHMCVMLANGLYQNNRIKEGREVMASIYDMACGKEGAIYPLIPEYFNRKGQGLYLYLTGSASWYVCTLMEEVLGIKSLLGDILLEPKLTAGDFCRGSIECEFRYYGKKIKVVFTRDKSSSEIYSVRRVTLNGNQVPFSTHGYIIKKKALSSRANVVNVLLG
jgi:cellobiose phosphorylase